MNTDRIYLLIARKISGEATAQELQELEQLLSQDPSLRYAFNIVDELDEWREENALPEAEEDELLDKGEQLMDVHINKAASTSVQLSNSRKWTKPLALAAMLLIILSVGLWGFFSRGTKTDDQKSEIATKVASKSTIVLPDGSKVWLNACSRLNYADGFVDGKRTVTLYGEGFFEVKHDPEHPFIIHAGNVNIKVLGTIFNVKAYPEDNTLETTLLKGKVEVDFNNASEQKVTLKPNQKITIYKNGEADKALKKKAENIKPPIDFAVANVKKDSSQSLAEVAWVNDRLEFNSEDFEELSHDLERRYNIHFYFKDDQYKKEVFSGAFGKQDIREVMQALQLTSDFKYRIDSLNNVYVW